MKKNKIEEIEIQTISEPVSLNTCIFNFNTSVVNSHINSFSNFRGNGNGNTIINLQKKDRAVVEDLENDVIKLKQRLKDLKDE